MRENDEKNIHAGHRRRMMERFAVSGFDGWHPHEIVEVLLYAVLTRVNTNIHGHRLINAFGSLKNLLEADADEIGRIHGIGPKSAEYLSGIRGDVSEMIKTQMRESFDFGAYQTAFLADWFMRDERLPVGMMIIDRDGRFEDFVCLPYQKKDGVIDAAQMFAGLDRELVNHSFCLFVRKEYELSREDVAEIRRYTFPMSFILEEIYLMRRKEPVPVLHPENVLKRVNA